MKTLLIAAGVLLLEAGLIAAQQQNGTSTTNPQSPDTEQNQRMTGTQGSTSSTPAGHQTDSTDRAVGASGTIEQPVTNPATLGTSSPSQKDANPANNSNRASDGAPVGSNANTARPDVKGSSGKVTPVDQGVERAPNPDKIEQQKKERGSDQTDTHNPEASNPTQPK
jgi:Tfp pilus assembly protein PilV